MEKIGDVEPRRAPYKPRLSSLQLLQHVAMDAKFKDESIGTTQQWPQEQQSELRSAESSRRLGALDLRSST